MYSYHLCKKDTFNFNIVKLLLISILVLLILRPILFPKKKKVEEPFYVLPYAEHKNTEDYYPKDSKLLFADNKCCKSCCKNLWPLPFDASDCDTCGNKYIASNYMCQGKNGAGCVCVTKEEGDYLDRRANNKMYKVDGLYADDDITHSMWKPDEPKDIKIKDKESTKGVSYPDDIQYPQVSIDQEQEEEEQYEEEEMTLEHL